MKPLISLPVLSGLAALTAYAYAQPTGSPSGGFLWAFVAGAAVGFAAGYYVGKNSGNSGSDDKDK